MLTFLLAAASQAATPAPPPPARDELEVVVSGKRDRQKQVRAFVKAFTPVQGTDPLARFDRKPTCPKAVGLTPALDAAITERLRAVGKAAGMDIARPGCGANALVLFAPDKKEMIAELRQQRPEWFYQNADEEVRIENEPGPAAAWYIQTLVDRSGLPLPIDPYKGHYTLVTTLMPSLISATVRPVMVASVVVIEQDAVIGLTTTQVADYAAMRAFTGAQPARIRKSGAPTILAALETPMGHAAPASLTRWDLAYLRGLYTVDANHRAQRQRTSIAREIERSLNEGE